MSWIITRNVALKTDDINQIDIECNDKGVSTATAIMKDSQKIYLFCEITRDKLEKTLNEILNGANR